MATVEALESFTNRGAGTDSERRAAGRLANELSTGAHESAVETFWCRPSWALAHAWHVALAVAGSLISVASPIAGVALLSIALLSVFADALTGVSLGRRLTPERASQNVVVTRTAEAVETEPRVRLILTANYDAGRKGLAYRGAIRRGVAALRRATGRLSPGWVGWVSIAILWLLAVAILRLEGAKSEAIGAAQLPPTVGLVVGFALLLELAIGDWSPSAGDNGSGVAVVVAVARELEVAPPRHLEVELVLTGAGDDDQIGLRRYLRARRRERRAANTVVLGIAACSGGSLHWWQSDGPFVPLRYARQLRELAGQTASEERHLGAAPHIGRGATPALAARMAGLPAITIGCLDHLGLAPRSHQQSDAAIAIDRGTIDRAIQFALLLIDGIDVMVGEARGQPAATPA